MTRPASVPADSTDAADPLLADLTGPQADAVRHTEGPLLVLAAAGSGKTRVITRRIAYLVRAGIPAWSILALTFTNKAAGEMRERTAALLGDNPRATRGLTVTTFHSLGARLLRRFADGQRPALAGVKTDFAIFDSADQAALMKKVIEGLQLSTANFAPRSMLSAISNLKNDLVTPAAYAARSLDFAGRNLAKIYLSYDRALRAANAVDFDDLLVLTARLLKDDDAARGDCRARWQYLLIDEYQDTNRAQFVIAALLAGAGAFPGLGIAPGGTALQSGAGSAVRSTRKGDAGPAVRSTALESGATAGQPLPNICVVGDPDQSIYGWRGADISNILDFEAQFPGCRVIMLGENFRSTAPILAVADTLIKQNKRRKDKPLFTTREGGEKVAVTLCRDEQHEAHLVTDWLKRLHEGDPDSTESGTPWREAAVLYRTNALSRVMEDTLRAAGVPYVIARGTAFYEREEVKSAIAYLRLVANPADDISLDRVVNTPARGIGAASMTAAELFAAQRQTPVFEALRRAEEVTGITARARNAMHAFVEHVDSWTGGGQFLGSNVPASLADLVARVIDESGLRAMYKKQAGASGSEADADRLDNLDELVSSARQFELEYDPEGDFLARPDDADVAPPPPLLQLLRAYLESIALVADADAIDPAQGAVTLMTLHAAKGLEFAAVAVVGLEENLLPHSRSRESDAALEEERRLFFVGLTRAMRHLLVTSARYRTVRGVLERTIPSRFLGELGREHLLVSDQASSFEHEIDRRGADWVGGDGDDPGESQPNRLRASRPIQPAMPIGAVVRHPQFGIGRVLEVTPGRGARARIQFRDAGVKTLILEYARLERLD